MSRRQKLLDKLRQEPPPKSFTWEELITLMKQHDFTVHAPAGGSHYTFQHSSGYTYGVSKTHPSGILKRYQVNDVRLAIEQAQKVK